VPAGVFYNLPAPLSLFSFIFCEFHIVVERESPCFLLMLSVKQL
jgi:hypothetical protein